MYNGRDREDEGVDEIAGTEGMDGKLMMVVEADEVIDTEVVTQLAEATIGEVVENWAMDARELADVLG